MNMPDSEKQTEQAQALPQRLLRTEKAGSRVEAERKDI